MNAKISKALELIQNNLNILQNEELEDQFVLISARYSMDQEDKMLFLKSEDSNLSKIILSVLQFLRKVISEMLLNVEQKKPGATNEIIISAEEAYNRLMNDYHLRNIFDSLIDDLDSNNKIRLLELFIEESVKKRQEYKNDFNQNFKYENNNDLTIKLQSKLNDNETKIFVSSILNYAKLGNGDLAFETFKYFKDEVDDLKDKEERENIAKYILSYYSDELKDSTSLAINKTFINIGKYIYSEDGINSVKSFCEFCIPHFGGSEVIEYEMDLFEQVINQLEMEIREEVISHLNKFLTPVEKVPKDNWFLKSAIKRGILDINQLK